MLQFPSLKKSFACAALLAYGLPLAFASEMKLVWADEFQYEGLPDPAKWGYEAGFVRNGERQYYANARLENSRVENGSLIIDIRKEKFPNPNYDASVPVEKFDPKNQPAFSRIANKTFQHAEYTSASLITLGKASWQYGRVEIRAKLPQGRGIWPALWMMGIDRGKVPWPACGEIDILEYVGHQPGVVHANVHCPDRRKPGADPLKLGMKAELKADNLHDAFHVYAVEWDAESVRVEFDGNAYFNYRNPHTGPDAWPFDRPLYLLLNVAVGGSWGEKQGIDDGIFPQRMEIDYVRVYQK